MATVYVAPEREAPVQTIPALVDRAAALSGRDALVMPGERLTFPELAERTVTIGRRLIAAGVGHGQRVGILHHDSIGSIAFMLAAMRVGAVPVTVNARYKLRETEHVVRHSGMRMLLADHERARELAAALPCPVLDGVDEAGFAAAGESVSAEEVERRTAAVAPDDDTIILYTSGTTANPKGCVYAHGGLSAQGFAYAGGMALGPGDCFFTPLPFFHVSAIVALAATLAAPCPLVHVGARFDPAVALDQIEQERCTIAFTAFETICLPILNQPHFASADLSALRLLVNTGTPGSLRRMQERLPHVPQVSAFGGTEPGGFATLGRAEDPLEARINTCGRPLPGVAIRSVDPATGEDVPPGAVGELHMRGPTRFVRYHDDPEQTARAIDEEGWYHSGDLGRVDEDGRVAFVGRLKDMLKVGGENVAAAEIETYLLTHPAIDIAQVVGAPDARYAEVPVAFLQLAPGAELGEDEVIDFCLGEIATFKVPRYVRFVEEWPMSGTKIQKFRLRERIAAELEAAGITEAPKLSTRSERAMGRS